MNRVHSNFRLAFIFLLGIPFMLTNLSCDKEGATIEPISEAKDQEVEDTLFSQFIAYNYPMKIFIPKEYENTKNLPVIYLLDGVLPSPIDNIILFDKVVGLMQNIGLKAILVAVGDRSGVNREIDFLAQGCTGGTKQGFSNFYNFLTQELIPYIDGKYESDQSKRTLIGFSHGGNFAYNALFREKPNNITFHGYVSVDPSICDNVVLEERIENMDLPGNSNIKVHLSQVDYDVELVYNLLRKKDFPWLFIDFEKYPNETHDTVIRPSIRQGLKFIYSI